MKAVNCRRVRLQALCTLDGLRKASPELLEKALSDSHPDVRRNAMRIAEGVLSATQHSALQFFPKLTIRIRPFDIS